MRVVVLSHEYPPVTGGAGTALAGMVAGTESLRDEYDVDLLVIAPNETRELRLVELGHRAQMVSIGVGKTLDHKGRWPATLRWVNHIRKLEFNADVYHVWGAMPNVWLARGPFILTLHGSDVPGRNPARNWLWRIVGQSYRKQWRRAAAITAVTGAYANLAERFLCDNPFVARIPNGVLLPPEVLRQKHNPLRLLMVTRLAPLKNVGLGLEIASLMGDEIILRIVGDGPETYERGQSNIEWAGWQQDVTAHYEWADILLNCAHAGGISMVMMEAKAHCLPIVAVNFPNWNDATGIYCCSDNAQCATAVIRHVANQYERCCVEARGGRTQFSWEYRARPYFELYRRIGGCK